MAINIRQTAIDDMVAHARAEAPLECCGLLIGTEGQIEHSRRARNLRRSRTRYLIDPADHFAALRAARLAGFAVVGFYHSHPASSARPSAVDQAEATYGDQVYVIVGLEEGAAEPRLGGYRLVLGNFQPVELVPIP